MEKPLETDLMVPQAGQGGDSGNHQGWVNSVSQADGDFHMNLSISSVGGRGLRKGRMASSSTFVWQKAATPPPAPALTLVPDNSVPYSMSLVPFELFPQHWSSEGIHA